MSTTVVLVKPCLPKQVMADSMMISRVSVAVVSTVTEPPRAPSACRREDQCARRYTGAGRNQHVLNAFHLIARGPSYLANALGDSVHAVDVGLAEQSAVCVDRQRPSEGKPRDRREILRLTAPAEAQFFELREHERGEMVVEEGGLNVGGFESGVAPELFGDDAHLRQTADVIAVIARHHLTLGGSTLHRGGDHRRGLAKVTRSLSAG